MFWKKKIKQFSEGQGFGWEIERASKASPRKEHKGRPTGQVGGGCEKLKEGCMKEGNEQALSHRGGREGVGCTSGPERRWGCAGARGRRGQRWMKILALVWP